MRKVKISVRRQTPREIWSIKSKKYRGGSKKILKHDFQILNLSVINLPKSLLEMKTVKDCKLIANVWNHE